MTIAIPKLRLDANAVFAINTNTTFATPTSAVVIAIRAASGKPTDAKMIWYKLKAKSKTSTKIALLAAQSANVSENSCGAFAHAAIKKYEPIAARNTHATSINPNNQRRNTDFFSLLQTSAMTSPKTDFLL